jgi:hypothetical protein
LSAMRTEYGCRDSPKKAQIKVEISWAISYRVSRYFYWLREQEKSARKSCYPFGNKKTRSAYWPVPI